MFPAVAVTVAFVRAALATAAGRQAAYWDALLVHTTAEAGCTAILTETWLPTHLWAAFV